MAQQPPHTPVVVREVAPTSAQTGVGDVILGSLGLVGVLLIGALVAGLLVGVLAIYLKKRRGRTHSDDADHARLNLSSF